MNELGEASAKDTDESANYKHPVFTKDPNDYMEWLYKEICVTNEHGISHTGRCYTVDPVSQSIVLVRIDNDNKSAEKIQVIMGHCIENVTILDDDKEKYKLLLDNLFKSEVQAQGLTPEEIKQRRESLKLWLLKNRIPVKISEDNDDVINISNAVFVSPPYGAENCRSTNEIILGRVQGLIKNMPKDHIDW